MPADRGLRELLQGVVDTLMSAEVDGLTGAAYGVRTPERTNRRNGYRGLRQDLDPWPGTGAGLPPRRANPSDLWEGLGGVQRHRTPCGALPEEGGLGVRLLLDMRLDEFVRLYGLRAPQIMCFLGAGAAAAASIPTATDMCWDFKRKLYCTRQHVSERSVGDLGDPIVRGRLQQYFDALGGFPSADADDEYAAYFETAYPDESDRQRYLAQHTTAARPSFGHYVLGALLHGERCRVVWTTNFDRGVEDGYARVAGSTTGLVVADPERADQALRAINDVRPVLGKLHGDFHSRRLRNATAELQAQDVRLREALVESARRYGLAVVGYSGRDASVMDALEEGIHAGRGYPEGLFWFRRAGRPLRSRVRQLLDRARAAGIAAETFEIETFDELMGDMMTVALGLPDDRQRPRQPREDRESRTLTPQHDFEGDLLTETDPHECAHEGGRGARDDRCPLADRRRTPLLFAPTPARVTGLEESGAGPDRIK